jgi:hypothetical protein
MSNKIGGRIVRSIPVGCGQIVLIVAVAGLLSSPLALAVPVATTQVSKYCEVRVGGYAFDQYSSGQQPFAQTTTCDLATPTGSAQGTASAGFGSGFPQIGITSTSGEIATDNGIAEGDFSASTQYHFEIQPIGTVPGTAPSLLPVTFSAYGEGYSWRSGYGITQTVGVAQLYGAPLGSSDAYFRFDTYVVDEIAYDPVDEEYQGGGFDGTKFVSLYPNYGYGVVLSAACSMWAGPTGQNAAASNRCAAQVSSSLGFDQAAFDAIMGADTFPLNQYYQFVISPNAVPIPPAVWLFGSGLLGLIGVARRKTA